MKKNNYIIIIIWIIMVYRLVKYLIPFWSYILYPINLFVTIMHEVWHWIASIITFWWVESIQINSDWSWLATTRWWFRPLVLMWWYIWSAILWSILMYNWFKNSKNSSNIMWILWIILILVWIFWYSTLFSLFILIVYWVIFIFLSYYSSKNFNSQILRFLWTFSLLYIIEDFWVWPSSDISKFSDSILFWIIPDFIYMFIWLIIVLLISYYTVKKIW